MDSVAPPYIKSAQDLLEVRLLKGQGKMPQGCSTPQPSVQDADLCQRHPTAPTPEGISSADRQGNIKALQIRNKRGPDHRLLHMGKAPFEADLRWSQGLAPAAAPQPAAAGPHSRSWTQKAKPVSALPEEYELYCSLPPVQATQSQENQSHQTRDAPTYIIRGGARGTQKPSVLSNCLLSSDTIASSISAAQEIKAEGKLPHSQAALCQNTAKLPATQNIVLAAASLAQCFQAARACQRSWKGEPARRLCGAAL
ncbi:hypothetical protein Anapl_05593 [Anas platyrhynchos]|uniref:Uncharacterized protein n=1 Tax=Anas platyrhynchos TaxID=8839 RepID=R0K0J8_ANAPL|nr:hypothetical protein Anapl_05593 [Anas platyrhynchos]